MKVNNLAREFTQPGLLGYMLWIDVGEQEEEEEDCNCGSVRVPNGYKIYFWRLNTRLLWVIKSVMVMIIMQR